jgi:hypothetical protein
MGTGFTRALGRIGHTLITRKECLKANLAFASASSGSAGFLSVGAITGIGTISSYVIEWRLGSTSGPIVLTTGYNPNQTVNAIHPFTNEPVQSGNLYAVVKYIVIDGIKYSPLFRQGQFSPDLKICFNYVSVASINCGNGTAYVPPFELYDHKFTYVNTIDPAINAERKIRFELNSDGTTKFLAVKFKAFEVSDQITIWYYKQNDPNNPVKLSDWTVGINNPDNFTSTPNHRSRAGEIQLIMDLNPHTYVIGDYILIHIIPRIKEPSNTNTNWTVWVKCFITFTNYVAPANSKEIDPTTIQISWDSVNCWYEVSFKNKGIFVLPDHYRNYITNGTLTNGEINIGDYYYDKVAERSKYRLRNTIDWYQWTIGDYPGTCVAAQDNINFTKSGSTLTITFNNVTDYNLYKTNYNTIVNNANWTNYSTDVTDVNHYKFFIIYSRFANSCGDSYTDKYIYIHNSANIVFNDGARTITITLVSKTNGVIQTACNTLYSKVNPYIANNNSSYSEADYNLNTRVISGTAFSGRYLTIWDRRVFEVVGYTGYYLEHYNLADNFKPDGFVNGGHWWYPNYYAFFLSMCKITITNQADPTNNFKVSNALNPDGTFQTNPNYFLVYEKQNGVQIYP